MKKITRTITLTTADVICYNMKTKKEESVPVSCLSPATESELLSAAVTDEFTKPIAVENIQEDTHRYSMDMMKFVMNSIMEDVEPFSKCEITVNGGAN